MSRGRQRPTQRKHTLLLDLFGFFDDSGSSFGGGLRFHPLKPTRIVDSRTGLGARTLHADSTATVSAPGTVAGDNTFALMLNVTAVSPTNRTFLTAWEDTQPRPLVSNLNPAAGQTVANGVITTVSVANAFDIHNSVGTTNVVVDEPTVGGMHRIPGWGSGG